MNQQEAAKQRADAQTAVLRAAINTVRLSAALNNCKVVIVAFGDDPAKVIMGGSAEPKEMEVALATAHAEAKKLTGPKLVLHDPTNGKLPDLRGRAGRDD